MSCDNCACSAPGKERPDARVANLSLTERLEAMLNAGAFDAEDEAAIRRALAYGEPRGGDQGWWLVHSELGVLHASKADGYGTDEDALANYVRTSEVVGEPDEFTCVLRMHEKIVRCLNLIRAGRANEVDEYPDLAALAVAAEALRRRRQ